MGPKVLKVVIVGKTGAGKSCLLQRYTHGNFYPDFGSTIGAAFRKHPIIMPTAGTVQTEIWDTGGTEKHALLIPTYTQKADAIVYVYDVTDAFDEAHYNPIINQAIKQNGNTIPIILVGNKANEDGTTTSKVAPNLKKLEEISPNIHQMTCSAKNNENVNEMFLKVAKEGYKFKYAKEIEREAAAKAPPASDHKSSVDLPLSSGSHRAALSKSEQALRGKRITLILWGTAFALAGTVGLASLAVSATIPSVYHIALTAMVLTPLLSTPTLLATIALGVCLLATAAVVITGIGLIVASKCYDNAVREDSAFKLSQAMQERDASSDPLLVSESKHPAGPPTVGLGAGTSTIITSTMIGNGDLPPGIIPQSGADGKGMKSGKA